MQPLVLRRLYLFNTLLQLLKLEWPRKHLEPSRTFAGQGRGGLGAAPKLLVPGHTRRPMALRDWFDPGTLQSFHLSSPAVSSEHMSEHPLLLEHQPGSRVPHLQCGLVLTDHISNDFVSREVTFSFEGTQFTHDRELTRPAWLGQSHLLRGCPPPSPAHHSQGGLAPTAPCLGSY